MPALSPAERVVLDMWRLMGGLDWAALPLVCEMYGVRDIHWAAVQLATIRDELHRQAEGARRRRDAEHDGA